MARLLFRNKSNACGVLEVGVNMILPRKEPNPVFKTAQPLPMLAGDPAAVRNCSVPFVIPRFPRGGADELKFRVHGLNAARDLCRQLNGGA
jgi:hypothetical protein